MSYPRFRNKLYIQELRRLTMCLGMQRDSLVKYLEPVDTHHKNDTYYSISSMNEMLNNKTANQVLHRTYNVYSAEYNTHVIRKALALLIQRRITFDELYEIRTLFDAYESEDLEGMPCNEHTIFRILKLAGRSIAPLQLQHQLKKMREEVDTVGRLQFYEFLDIIPHTSYINNIDIPFELVDGKAKDGQLLYKIDDFHSILHTFDEKVQKKLDIDYRKILSKSFHIEHSKKSKGHVNYINKDKQTASERGSKVTYLNLKNTLKQTNNNISLSRNGRFSRNITDDDHMKRRIANHIQSKTDTESSKPLENNFTLLSPLISPKDTDKQNALIEELEWEMLNNDEKYRIGVSKTLDEIKTKKKYRENRNLFSQPPSTARKTADVFTARVSRPSTMNDVFELYSNFDEDVSFRTKLTSSGTFDLIDDQTDSEHFEKPFKDITLDDDYQLKKHKIMERVKLIKTGKRLIDM